MHPRREPEQGAVPCDGEFGPSATTPQQAAGTYSVTPGGRSSDSYSFDYVAGAFGIGTGTGAGIRFESGSNAQNESAPNLGIGRETPAR